MVQFLVVDYNEIGTHSIPLPYLSLAICVKYLSAVTGDCEC